ncbi:MAG: hypothetical protein ACM30I_05225 [Gemmatimonas sp.]
MKRHLRIITYAWGRSYVTNLLDVTLAAVLAPGNLPALAETFDCEFVLLTEQGLFEDIEAHPVYRRLASIARARLVAIDDLLVAPLYGMTLTWATYRGMADLGEAVTDTDFLFFTADWIPADGSYRALIPHLLNRERLIVAPSYCVVSEKVLPELHRRIDPETGVLAMAKRDMAALAIPNRHNTIRGKTINTHLFHMDVVEQFYWLVDRYTLLAHQMPIAIVCMRPERWKPEPDTFWDYGTVSELCPNVTPCVLSDSDDFLMIELRSESTYDDGLRLGWPDVDAIGRKLAGFVTRDHTVYGRHSLTLHARDLPPGTDDARAKLKAFVDRVFTHFEGKEVSHVGHPYWAFQSSLFDLARRHVATGVGAGGRPLWSFFSKALTGVVNHSLADYRRTSDGGSAAAALAHLDRLDDAVRVEEAIHQRDVALTRKEIAELRHEAKERVRAAAYATERATATAPALSEIAPANVALPNGLSERIRQAIARPGAHDPMWAATRHARRLLDDALAAGAADILWIASDGSDRLSRFSSLGTRPRTALPAAHAAYMAPDDLARRGSFDMCVIEVEGDDLQRLKAIVENVASTVRGGGKIIAFYVHPAPRRLPADPSTIRRVFPSCDYGLVHYGGSWPSMVAIRGTAAVERWLGRLLPRSISAAFARLLFAVPSMIANHFEKTSPESPLMPPRTCTTMTIEIEIPSEETTA